VRIPPRAALAPPTSLLSPSELARTSSFGQTPARPRFQVSHSALRIILAGYLRADLALVQYETTATGKPHLIRLAGWPDLRFSLAHSGEIALVAVTTGVEVGVDVEQVREMPDAIRVAARFLGADVASGLAAAEPKARPALLLRAWTRVEACVKMTGAGLTGLNSDSGAPGSITGTGGPGAQDRYGTSAQSRFPVAALTSFVPADGYVGALCLPVAAKVDWLEFEPPW
jgi:phosphopantetheinyl transferase